MTFKFTLQETIQNVKCKIFAFWYTSFVNYKRSNVLNVLCMRSIINTQIVYKDALFCNWNEIMKSSNELKSDRSLDIKMPSYFIFTEIENHYASLHFGYKRPSFFLLKKTNDIPFHGKSCSTRKRVLIYLPRCMPRHYPHNH